MAPLTNNRANPVAVPECFSPATSPTVVRYAPVHPNTKKPNRKEREKTKT